MEINQPVAVNKTILLAMITLGIVAASCQSGNNKSPDNDSTKTTIANTDTGRGTSPVDTLHQAPGDQVASDLSQRSSDIHWPEGFSPETADLFAHNEIIIHAPASTVFRHIQEAEKWPSWYSNSQNVKIHNSSSNLLKEGTQFDWDTFGVHIHSHVHEFVQDSRLGWFGDGKGMNAYHTWYLRPTPDGGTKIIMEECVKGPAAVALRKSDPAVMHRGHDLWNNSLQKICM